MQYFSKKNLRIYKEIFLYVSIAICKLEALSIQEFFIPISEEKANVSGIEEIHQIYVLNLEVRLARWFRTKAMLNAFGIEAQRFIGINGWMIPRGKMKNFYKELVENGQHGGLTPGQIGCLLSHLSILQHALDKKYQCVWILEDDIVVLRDPKELGDILKKLHQVDPEWDLLFTDLHARGNSLEEILSLETLFGSWCEIIKTQDSFFEPYEDEDFIRVQYRLCTHSMILSHRGIKKLLDYFQSTKIFLPIDVQMHCCPNKRFYVSRKEYVTNGKRETSDTTYRPRS